MKRLLSATAMVLASATIAAAEGKLQLYNWGNYTSPELLKKFETETGIKVTVTDFDSNDVALAKVEAGRLKQVGTGASAESSPSTCGMAAWQ